jgi:hypothetical protein
MTLKDVIDVMGSVISVITIVFIFLAYRQASYQLRLNARNEFQKMLLEANKTLVASPELWSIYDENKFTFFDKKTPENSLKLESFTYMMLNIFESVFSFYGDSKGLRESEKVSYASWKGYFKNFLEGSSLARRLIGESRVMYTSHLINEFDSITNVFSK